MTTCTVTPEQQTEVEVAANDQTLSGIADTTVVFVADQKANPNMGQAFATTPAELQPGTTPRNDLSITLGRAKPSIADYKPSMLDDTSFIPRTIALSQLKDVVKNHNYTFWHYKNNYRNGSNFSFSSGIILDFDGDSGMSVDEATECAKEMNCYALLATSYSHMCDKKKKDGSILNGPCFRLLIPTCRLFHSWADLFSSLNFVNDTYFNGKADPAGMLVSQFFVPSPDNATVVEINNDTLYDPDDLRRENVIRSDSTTIVRDAWNVENCSILKDPRKNSFSSLPPKKTVVYCPFCDDLQSTSVSAFLMEPKEGEDRRAIQCSHCKKMYVSEQVMLTDEQFVARFFYTADSVGDTSEPVEWIVKDVVGKKEIFSCYGDPGSGKSFAMMQLAISVADESGTLNEWLGFPVERHGPVLYILTDGSHRSLRERIRRISGYMKVQRPKDLIIQLNQGVYSTWKEQVDRLIRIRKPVMIILDSLAMSSDTGDENQAEDQKEFAKILQLWSLEQDLAFCIIHHTNKAAMNNAFHQNNFRGSSYWIGIISSMLEFRKCSNKTNQYKLVKSRDGSPDAQTIREAAYEEYTPSAPGTYNLNQDQIIAGYKYVGPVSDTKSTGRKTVATWAGEIFRTGETKTYKDTLEAIQGKYARSQSWAKETLKDWKDLGDVKISRNTDGTKSYTFSR
jgi:hypothetical protein